MNHPLSSVAFQHDKEPRSDNDVKSTILILERLCNQPQRDGCDRKGHPAENSFLLIVRSSLYKARASCRDRTSLIQRRSVLLIQDGLRHRHQHCAAIIKLTLRPAAFRGQRGRCRACARRRLHLPADVVHGQQEHLVHFPKSRRSASVEPHRGFLHEKIEGFTHYTHQVPKTSRQNHAC